ncbi:Ig-like domain-containing protein [Photobacterium leiognathi]|uniref:Ig-like domain-containing protein n=1 Tax=Photobacterium leiognathi TaxID=553611 RepID=UPI00273941BC|nr:Ig-like domain-containing protein [Photobacterium leiognathi]
MSNIPNHIFSKIVLLYLMLLQGCHSEELSTKLERIDISASSIKTQGISQLTLTAGNQQAFTAVGYYSDGSSHILTDLNLDDWHTNDKKVGFFSAPGILTAASTPDLLSVNVIKEGITSNTIYVNVTAAIITDITIMPSSFSIAKGQTQQLVTTAIYSDNTSSDVSHSVTWTPDDTGVATVTSKGMLSGVEDGSTTITANKNGITSNIINVTVTAATITDITVTPSSISIAKGQTQQLAATAIYSDNTSSDVSNSVTWTPDNTSVATVTSKGMLSGVEDGSTTITANKNGITSNTANITVTAATITDITVTPSPISIAKGQTQQLVATVIYSDNTSSDVSNSVTWTPDNTSVATVTSKGTLYGTEVGSTTITANKNGITSNTANITVTAAIITDIIVSPSSVFMLKGKTQQLVATAVYTDNTSSDVSSSVTWTPLDTSIATVTPTGQLSGVEDGSTTITAYKDNITSNTVSVDVCNLADTCIDIFDSGNKVLFTSSPSVAYLDSIGGSANNGEQTEDGIYGPAGSFYLFDWNNANLLCDKYNVRNLAGRSNWRLAKSDELEQLFSTNKNMFNSRGWPTIVSYWSTTENGSLYFYVRLFDGYTDNYFPTHPFYASCISGP